MSNDFKKKIGERVKAIRKAKGFTQEQLAEKIDKTVETVSNIERGKKLPSLITLEEIRKALNSRMSDFLD